MITFSKRRNDINTRYFRSYKQKNIDYKIINHKRVYTIEEIKDINLEKVGLIPKNIFLRNTNGKVHYLVTCHPDKKVDIKRLTKDLVSTRLSFGSSERLKKYLNVEKGSVSPLGFIYDKNYEVIFAFDKELINKTIGVHPNRNDYTIFIKFKTLVKLIEEHGNKIVYLDI